jgi:hypothetical protein
MTALFSLLPFLLLLGFWVLLMRNYQQRRETPNDLVVERLDAILDELGRIRRELGQQNGSF